MNQETGNIKEMLFDALGVQLLAEGFIRKGKSGQFVRKSSDLAHFFQLVCLDGRPGWRIQPNIGIRFDCVEKIFHQTSDFEPKYQKDTCTVGAPAGVIMGGTARSCEFILETSEQVSSVAENILKIFREIAAPYYAQWSLIHEIDAALNDDPSARVHYLRGGLAWFRCSTGVITAKLEKRINYDQLVAFYGDIMARDNNGFYLKRFQALVKSLDSVA